MTVAEPLRQILDSTRAILYFDAQVNAGLTRSLVAAAAGLVIWLAMGTALVRWYDRKGLSRIDPPLLEYVARAAQQYKPGPYREAAFAGVLRIGSRPCLPMTACRLARMLGVAPRRLSRLLSVRVGQLMKVPHPAGRIPICLAGYPPAHPSHGPHGHARSARSAREEFAVPSYVLTGAPGAGKTAVLRLLEASGYPVVEEAATDVIALGNALGNAEPWHDHDFIDKVITLRRQRQDSVQAAGGATVFFDRSPMCTLALRRYLGFTTSRLLDREVSRVVAEATYEPMVFFIRNQGFIKPTAARNLQVSGLFQVRKGPSVCRVPTGLRHLAAVRPVVPASRHPAPPCTCG